MTLNRRETMILAASASLAACYGLTPAYGQAGTTKDVNALANVAHPDHPLGAEDAPVTVIEYAAPTCPHCANFHNTVYPSFQAAYVDTGKVRYIVRPFFLRIHDAVVFMLAEAAGPEQFHSVLATYFKNQSQWLTAERPRDELLAIAMQIGFTEAAFDEALSDQDLFANLEKVSNQARDEFGLTGTPTFYINGKQFTGGMTLVQLGEAIDPLIPADFEPTTASDTPAMDAPAMEAPAMDAPAMNSEAPASN